LKRKTFVATFAFKKEYMNCSENIRNDIIATAEHAIHYTELLIAQCENWLSEEEGCRNMERQIMERHKKQRLKHDKS
jgi:hypothetical protein